MKNEPIVKTPIAIITSTISPPRSDLHGVESNLISPEHRFEQTQETIKSLITLGIEHIVLVDNSSNEESEKLLNLLTGIKIINSRSPQFRNKGLSELWMLQKSLEWIPENTPILKISGRYSLTKKLDKYLDGAVEFVGRRYGRSEQKIREGMKYTHVSTVAYVVKNIEIFEKIINRTMNEVYGYASKIVGPMSFLRICRNSLFPFHDHYNYSDPSISIELGLARALDALKIHTNYVDSLGVEGRSGQNNEIFCE